MSLLCLYQLYITLLQVLSFCYPGRPMFHIIAKQGKNIICFTLLQCPEHNSTKIVLTTVVLIPSLTHFLTHFTGPACPISYESILLTITIPSLEEDSIFVAAISKAIAVTLIPWVAPLSLGAPSCDQIQNNALELARGHSPASGNPTEIEINLFIPELFLISVDGRHFHQHFGTLHTIGDWMQQFKHPTPVHPQLALGAHLYQIDELNKASRNNYDQFVAFQQWDHDLLELLYVDQRDLLVVQQHLQSTTCSLCALLPMYLKKLLQAYKEGIVPWCTFVESSLTAQDAVMKKLIEQKNQF
ncbi:hypothetical protein DSO57_1009090 [Entomophthora muscae]|uniref:Uncharacterized protein n=1 Tax=Entomophthora muscae TaxID=34485 RepID=A0ACC2S8Y9_9FUNG|nr:hypothetical protein DSO57_1009090 [Entomophthora muscae]